MVGFQSEHEGHGSVVLSAAVKLTANVPLGPE